MSETKYDFKAMRVSLLLGLIVVIGKETFFKTERDEGKVNPVTKTEMKFILEKMELMENEA